MREYVQGVDDTWDITKDGQQDVDEEISSAATLKEDTERWEDDGENDLADIAVERVSNARKVVVRSATGSEASS